MKGVFKFLTPLKGGGDSPNVRDVCFAGEYSEDNPPPQFVKREERESHMAYIGKKMGFLLYIVNTVEEFKIVI